KDDQLIIYAPFLSLPEKNRIPLLRQVANLNISSLVLAKISMRDEMLYFCYSCPLSLVNPVKIYSILYDICLNGDKYDDEFSTKFGAKRICEPIVTPYDSSTLENVYNVIQLSCNECLTAVSEFEPERKFGYAWNMITTTLLKILYYAHPQGQLLNDLNKAFTEINNEEVPIPDLVKQGKELITKLVNRSQEQLAEHLYYIETFVPTKRRSNLTTLQADFEESYAKAAANLEADNFMDCCMILTYKFYEVYYYNHLQDDINDVIAKAMQEASAKNWEEAATILFTAMDKIMEGELEPETETAKS
ncbi:MAG: hypothetical protein RR550_02775, partial [Rikenellaceae bacterium]